MKNLKLIFGIITLVLFIASCGGSPKPAGSAGYAGSGSGGARVSSFSGDELDIAIRDASDYLNENLPEGSTIVILNIESDSTSLSDYIIEELIANAVNDKIFTVVDRQQLDAIRAEQNFQFSGEVDDNLALEIGRFFGAQTIVSGSLRPLGARYRLTIRALGVQTAQVQGQYNRNITAVDTIRELLKDNRPAPATAAAAAARPAATTTPAPAAATPAPAPAPAATAAPAPAPAPAVTAAPRNGTYTFYPRLRAIRGGVDVNAYIDRITVRGEFLNIYLTNVPVGRGGNPAGEWSNSWRISGNEFFIQDLDRPTRTWVRVNHGSDEVTGGMFLTYQGVTATRFSLTSRSDNPHMIFDEIILRTPD